MAFSVEAFPDDEDWVAKGRLGPDDKVLDLGEKGSLIKRHNAGRVVGCEINDKRAEEPGACTGRARPGCELGSR